MNYSEIVDVAFQQPFLKDDPFAHVVFDIYPLPHLHAYDFLSYVMSVWFGSPTVSVLSAMIISIVSQEWWEHKSFRRELFLSIRTVFFASPFIAFFLKNVFEQKVGFLSYDTEPFDVIYHYFFAPVGYLLLADMYFYWTHRFWHIPWVYVNSHYIHHACRPTNTFAGTAADVFEVVLSGQGSTLFPILILPMTSRVYLTMILFTEFWTMYIHNNSAHKMPRWINDSLRHNIHHYYGQQNYNYGLFFEFWDRSMGTYKDTVPVSVRLNGGDIGKKAEGGAVKKEVCVVTRNVS